MKNKSVLYKIAIVVFLVSIWTVTNAQGDKDKFSTIHFKKLEELKLAMASGNEEALKGLNRLIKEADKLLKTDGFSVVDKVGVPPSGTKHDYMSIGPYWWPNPETENGLPYIRKDGEINPESRNNYTDFTTLEDFISAVKTLNSAFYLTNAKKYASKSLELINTWFLDENTKMNPNVNYGQYVPGESEGRCFGIIEFGGITEVIKFLELAKDRNALDKTIENGMLQWFSEYSHWLKFSELGKEEATRMNNHGTHYDVQLLRILMYLNKIEEVKGYLSSITKQRIFSQIEPGGSQPLELARTKSFSYSVMNLHGFLELAIIGQQVGVNLWDTVSEDGRSIKAGYQYLLPYLTGKKDWEYQQIIDKKHSEEKLISDLKLVKEVFNDTFFDKALAKLNKVKAINN